MDKKRDPVKPLTEGQTKGNVKPVTTNNGNVQPPPPAKPSTSKSNN